MTPRRKRILFWILLPLLVLLLIPTVAWFYVTSDAGAELIRNRVLGIVNEDLKGRLEAKSLTTNGGLIVIDGLKLFTPEGELVVEIDHAELDPRLWALAKGKIVLWSLKVTKPRFYLKTDERGLNLSRAIESKLPAATKKELKLYVDIGTVAIDEGYFDYAFGENNYTVQQIHIDGKATVSLPTLSLLGDLHLGAHVTAPMVDVLNIDVSAKTDKPGDVRMDLFAKTSDTHIRGQLSLDPVQLVVTESVASPIAVRAFAPGFKLKVPISTKGTASPRAFDVTAEAGSARIAAKASFPKDGLLEALELHASGIDLSELIEGGRKSHLAGDLTGSLHDVGIDTFTGALKGQARWEEEGKPLATADIDVTAKNGHLEIKQLDAKVPGASMNVRGKGDRKTMAVNGGLEVTDLRAVARTIADFTGGEVLPLSGQGSLRLATAGPLLHPALSVQGGFKTLRYDDIQVQDFKINAQLADVMRPLEAQAQISAARLEFGTTVLEGLSAEMASSGRALTAKLSTKGLATMAMSVLIEATLDKDNHGLLLTGLTVDYPRLQWTLEGPAHVGWTDEGDFTAEPIALHSDNQRVIVDANLKAERLLVNAQLAAIDLTRLPAALIPATLKLGGFVDAKAKLYGPTGKLQTETQLAWHTGTFKGLSGITVVARAHTADDRIDGEVTANTSLGQAAGEFAVPLGRKLGKPQPVTVRFSTSALQLSGAAMAFGGELPVDGAVTTTIEIEGTLDQPKPNIQIESPNLRICEGPCAPKGKVLAGTTKILFDRTVFSLTGDAEHHPDVALTVNALGGLTQLKLKVPFTFAQLLDAYLPATPRNGGPPAKPKGINWLLTPMQVNLEATGIDLLKVGPVVQLSSPLKGKLHLVAQGTGNLTHPDLTATVGIIGLQSEGKHPVEVNATLTTNRDDSRVTLNVLRVTRPVLSLTGRMGGPLELVRNEAALMETGVIVDAEVGPVAMADLFMKVEDEDAPPTGTLRATLAVKGTAAAPKGSLRGTLENLKVGSVALGQANLSWDYDARKHSMGLMLTSGGRLKATGELDLDISVPAVRKGLALATAPLKATVSSSNFDVGFFSGAHPMVRTLGGVLNLEVKIDGPLFNPGFDGNVEWNRGRLGIAGFGDYRDMRLVLSGTNAGYTLKELTASAGGGNLSLTGKATRDSPGNFTLSAEGKLTKFPIITDDQLLAIATLRMTVDGEASARLVNLQRLSIPEAHIELPDVKRKDLQELERPQDIVLVRNGIPVKKKKKKPDAASMQASLEASRTFRVTIDAPRNLWVKSSDVNLEIGLSDKFRIEYTDRILIYGEASVMRGRVDVLGRRFDMQKNSQVRFNGIATQPYLNVTAVHVNERENVTVYVTVIGKGKDATLKLSSQPPIPDSELLILVTTGRRTLKRGGGSSLTGADAASLLGSVVASQLKTLVAKRLPLDVLSIESGEAGIQDARVEAGVYLSDRAYVGVQFDLGADKSKGENAYAAKLEYQLSKQWSVEATAGDAPAVGASLLWSRDF
jgi:translocation and assembly module TamB